MSNINEMLALANAMGKNVVIRRGLNDYESLCVHKINSKPFNPSTEELIEWLLTKGWFTTIQSDWAVFQQGHEFTESPSYDFEGIEDTLKQNILNISIQVAKHLEDEKL